MDDKKKAYKELMKKKIGDLREIAGRLDPPVKLKTSWTKDKITKLILERRIVPVTEQIHKDLKKQERMDAASGKHDPQEQGVSHPSVFERKEQQQPVKPEFEQAVKSEPVTDKHGGVRKGAGRSMGLTAEKAKVKNLPQYPSTPIKQGVQSLFDLWASAAKIEQLALTEKEADMLSLPITQLQEYYFPGILPEIAGTWIMMIFAASRILKPRVDMINTVREQRKERKVAGIGIGKGQEIHYRYKIDDSLKPLHAIAPDEPANFTDDLNGVTCPTCLKIIEKARPK